MIKFSIGRFVYDIFIDFSLIKLDFRTLLKLCFDCVLIFKQYLFQI